MSAPAPNPEAKLYGLRYVLSYIQQLRAAGVEDRSFDDQTAFLALLSRFTSRHKSQLGQDVFALAMNGFRRQGYFVEVGAHHGEKLSNSWLLENEYGWIGLLIEPNPANHATLHARKAALVVKAAWKRSGERLVFHATKASGLSTLAGVTPGDLHDRSQFEAIEVETMTLDDILAEAGAPRVIDYLSIDVEGAETDVLDGLSLDRWDVRAMSLEHNNDKQRAAEFDRRLGSHGLVRVLEIVSDFDAYYTRPECMEAWRRGSLPGSTVRSSPRP